MLQQGRKMRRKIKLKIEIINVKGNAMMATMTLPGLWHMFSSVRAAAARRGGQKLTGCTGHRSFVLARDCRVMIKKKVVYCSLRDRFEGDFITKTKQSFFLICES